GVDALRAAAASLASDRERVQAAPPTLEWPDPGAFGLSAQSWVGAPAARPAPRFRASSCLPPLRAVRDGSRLSGAARAVAGRSGGLALNAVPRLRPAIASRRAPP